jgi:hypothetical protein
MGIEKVKNEVTGVYGEKRQIQKTSVPQRSTVSRQEAQKEKTVHKEISTCYYLRCIATWSS